MKRIKMKSNVTTGIHITNLDEISDYIAVSSYCLFYCDDEVALGLFEDGKWLFHNNQTPDYSRVQRIRIFNQDEELYLWRVGSKLSGRLRKDGIGEECDVIEAEQILVGSIFNEHIAVLSDSRGMKLTLPLQAVKYELKKGDRIAIKTHNYIGFTENSLATYIDSRFVEFTEVK